eukprot:scaffold87243_cov17-Tisochrysis_lutea.AAC.4
MTVFPASNVTSIPKGCCYFYSSKQYDVDSSKPSDFLSFDSPHPLAKHRKLPGGADTEYQKQVRDCRMRTPYPLMCKASGLWVSAWHTKRHSTVLRLGPSKPEPDNGLYLALDHNQHLALAQVKRTKPML